MKNKSSIRFGTYLGLALIATHLLWFILDMLIVTPADQLTTVILIFVFIILSMKELRDIEGDGYIKYKHAFFQGVKTVAYASILYSAYYFIFIQFIDPEYIVKTLDAAEEQYYAMAESGFIEEDKVEEMIELAREKTTPLFTVMNGILALIFGGSIVSLIAAAFMKKNNPNPFEA